MIPERIRTLFKDHGVAMALICAAPLVIIAALSYSGFIGTWGLYAILLIGPLGLLVMMGGTHAELQAAKQKVGVITRPSMDN